MPSALRRAFNDALGGITSNLSPDQIVPGAQDFMARATAMSVEACHGASRMYQGLSNQALAVLAAIAIISSVVFAMAPGQVVGLLWSYSIATAVPILFCGIVCILAMVLVHLGAVPTPAPPLEVQAKIYKQDELPKSQRDTKPEPLQVLSRKALLDRIQARLPTHTKALLPGDRLAARPGNNACCIFGACNEYELVMQDDGNLVIYQKIGDKKDPMWASGSHEDTHAAVGEYRLDIQEDGNVVIYVGAEGSNSIWATGTTDSRKGAFLALRPEGRLMVYDLDFKSVWSTPERKLIRPAPSEPTLRRPSSNGRNCQAAQQKMVLKTLSAFAGQSVQSITGHNAGQLSAVNADDVRKSVLKATTSILDLATKKKR